ncbi:MAG: TolC family protein [Armatimonadetes bacterium]|nr:TolC family protein [Armatimonadota bacterium]
MNLFMQPVAGIVLVLACTQAAHTPPPFTVDDAVRMALQRNPAVRAARMAREASQVQAGRDKPVPRPVVTAEAGTLFQSPVVTFPRGADDAVVLPERFSQVRVTLDQPIYRAGVADAWRRYRAMLAASEAQVQRAENDLIRDVRKAYLNALTARDMTRVASEACDVASRHLALAQRLVEAGLSAPRDLKAADADLAEAHDGLIQAENGLQLAVGNLRRLTGADEPNSDAPLADVELRGPDTTESEAIATALKRRPELHALRLGIEAARAGEALARSQSGPVVSVRASASRQTPSAFTARDWAGLGFLITWPILDGGKRDADVHEAHARTGELRALLDEAEAGIRLQVRSAVGAVRLAEARIVLADRRLVSARAALEISELRYEQRAATMLEVAAARLAVARAAATLCQARNELPAAYADLRHATAADLPRGADHPGAAFEGATDRR